MGNRRSNAVAVLMGAAITLSAAAPVLAGSLYESRYDQEPDGAEMLADVVLVRPATFIASAVGAVGWVISLPFTALGGNVEEAGEVLVKEPMRYTILRPVGYMEEGTPPRRQQTVTTSSGMKIE